MDLPGAIKGKGQVIVASDSIKSLPVFRRNDNFFNKLSATVKSNPDTYGTNLKELRPNGRGESGLVMKHRNGRKELDR